MTRPPEVIAHRGYTAEHPENTLPALQAALDASAPGIEVDVQFTRDDVPVLLHDVDLLRMAGDSANIHDIDLARLRMLRAREAGRLRDQDASFATLAEAAALLASAPDVTVFVEIKRASLPRHNLPAAVQSVLEVCAPLGERLVVISFDEEVLQVARSLRLGVRVGWVLSGTGRADAERAATLEPDFLFCDRDRLPTTAQGLWPGPWHWVAYEINDVAQAQTLRRRGVACIETANVAEMVAAFAGKEEPRD